MSPPAEKKTPHQQQEGLAAITARAVAGASAVPQEGGGQWAMAPAPAPTAGTAAPGASHQPPGHPSGDRAGKGQWLQAGHRAP